eukprot:gnl/MRDRNA2_/MRDRNA2_109395_c0_seq1.p1 gnl/MRDRNA2_/MRDRNA2_109395_c0~~gnl/MRDRNA2_/MRDRNA2_109395_c0_seq1.p1  ORF type:complete len:1228 (-),score=258.62 gnl/MRDRNA2_/MRDRNA2_109395_c0_seq1:53-3574(-)
MRAHVLSMRDKILDFTQEVYGQKVTTASNSAGSLEVDYELNAKALRASLSSLYVKSMHGVTGRCCCIPPSSVPTQPGKLLGICRWHPSSKYSNHFNSTFFVGAGCQMLGLLEYTDTLLENDGAAGGNGLVAANECGDFLERTFFERDKPECGTLDLETCRETPTCLVDVQTNRCHHRDKSFAADSARAAMKRAIELAKEETCMLGVSAVKQALYAAHAAVVEPADYQEAVAYIAACAEAEDTVRAALSNADVELTQRALDLIGADDGGAKEEALYKVGTMYKSIVPLELEEKEYPDSYQSSKPVITGAPVILDKGQWFRVLEVSAKNGKRARIQCSDGDGDRWELKEGWATLSDNPQTNFEGSFLQPGARVELKSKGDDGWHAGLVQGINSETGSYWILPSGGKQAIQVSHSSLLNNEEAEPNQRQTAFSLEAEGDQQYSRLRGEEMDASTFELRKAQKGGPSSRQSQAPWERTVDLGPDVTTALQSHFRRVLDIRSSLDESAAIMESRDPPKLREWEWTSRNADTMVELWTQWVRLGRENTGISSEKTEWLLKPSTGLCSVNFDFLENAFAAATEQGLTREAQQIRLWINRVSLAVGSPDRSQPGQIQNRCEILKSNMWNVNANLGDLRRHFSAEDDVKTAAKLTRLGDSTDSLNDDVSALDCEGQLERHVVIDLEGRMENVLLDAKVLQQEVMKLIGPQLIALQGSLKTSAETFVSTVFNSELKDASEWQSLQRKAAQISMKTQQAPVLDGSTGKGFIFNFADHLGKMQREFTKAVYEVEGNFYGQLQGRLETSKFNEESAKQAAGRAKASIAAVTLIPWAGDESQITSESQTKSMSDWLTANVQNLAKIDAAFKEIEDATKQEAEAVITYDWNMRLKDIALSSLNAGAQTRIVTAITKRLRDKVPRSTVTVTLEDGGAGSSMVMVKDITNNDAGYNQSDRSGRVDTVLVKATLKVPRNDPEAPPIITVTKDICSWQFTKDVCNRDVKLNMDVPSDFTATSPKLTAQTPEDASPKILEVGEKEVNPKDENPPDWDPGPGAGSKSHPETAREMEETGKVQDAPNLQDFKTGQNPDDCMPWVEANSEEQGASIKACIGEGVPEADCKEYFEKGPDEREKPDYDKFCEALWSARQAKAGAKDKGNVKQAEATGNLDGGNGEKHREGNTKKVNTV